MGDKTFVILEGRGVVRVEGPDARPFIQGLISNDIDRVAADRALYAALLTPQGKYLHDFFLVRMGGQGGAETGAALYLDCEAARAGDLLRRLSLYRLRAKVALAEAGADFTVAALLGGAAGAGLGVGGEAGCAVPFGGGIAYVDPRCARAGLRALLPRDGAEAALGKAGFAPAPPADYERLRLGLGLPDGSRDMEPERAMPLECGLDELHALDWDKGCYMGQELTSRTKHRGLIRKRLMPVAIEGPVPAPGTAVMAGGREVGTMRSGFEDRGLALLRVEAVEKAGGGLTAGEARLTPRKPDWAAF